MRYLNPSALVAARHLASEAMRPRRASRVRAYAPAAPATSPPLDILHAVLEGLHRLDVTA